MELDLIINNYLSEEPDENMVSLFKRAAEIALSERCEIDGRICELNLALCNDEEIREYNAEYRMIDKATDVLSFPMIDDWEEIVFMPDELPVIIGDIIISVPMAKRQAEEYCQSFEREMVFLFIHGVLHCLGYDHMEADEEMEMRQKQREILRQIYPEENIENY